MQNDTHYTRNDNFHTMNTNPIIAPCSSSQYHLPNHTNFEYPRLVGMKLRDLRNCHTLCLTRLLQTAREVELLRLENAALRSFNVDLKSKLSISLQAHDPLPLEYRDLDGRRGRGGMREEDEESSTTCMMDSKNIVEEEAVEKRVSMPKSISVRSTGYLKYNNNNAKGEASKPWAVSRSPTPVMSYFVGAPRVYVRGGKENKEPLELEVYNQSMCKTELCNKWQEITANSQRRPAG